MLNIIAACLGAFLQLGSEVALDEATVACSSRYGRDFFFFNSSKNCGKYHFKLYLLNCATTYACIKLRIHMKDKANYIQQEDDGTMELEEVLQQASDTDNLSKMSALILDMCSPLYGKGHTVNTDNYCTFVIIVILLLAKCVYMHGTIRTN
jgi:hypothetical protein